jgi:hypothetical protein
VSALASFFALLQMALIAVMIVVWIGVLIHIATDLKQFAATGNFHARPNRPFRCRACGSGPWHEGWADADIGNLCPNCSGAD